MPDFKLCPKRLTSQILKRIFFKNVFFMPERNWPNCTFQLAGSFQGNGYRNAAYARHGLECKAHNPQPVCLRVVGNGFQQFKPVLFLNSKGSASERPVGAQNCRSAALGNVYYRMTPTLLGLQQLPQRAKYSLEIWSWEIRFVTWSKEGGKNKRKTSKSCLLASDSRTLLNNFAKNRGRRKSERLGGQSPAPSRRGLYSLIP